MNFERHGIPLTMRDSIQQHVDIGKPTGSFLTALFTNELVETACRADETNIYLLRQYAKFMYNEMPPLSWGSKAAVAKWIKHRGLEGLEQEESQ